MLSYPAEDCVWHAMQQQLNWLQQPLNRVTTEALSALHSTPAGADRPHKHTAKTICLTNTHRTSAGSSASQQRMYSFVQEGTPPPPLIQSDSCCTQANSQANGLAGILCYGSHLYPLLLSCVSKYWEWKMGVCFDLPSIGSCMLQPTWRPHAPSWGHRTVL